MSVCLSWTGRLFTAWTSMVVQSGESVTWFHLIVNEFAILCMRQMAQQKVQVKNYVFICLWITHAGIQYSSLLDTLLSAWEVLVCFVGAVWALPPTQESRNNSLLALRGKYFIISLSFTQGVPVARLHYAERCASIFHVAPGADAWIHVSTSPNGRRIVSPGRCFRPII